MLSEFDVKSFRNIFRNGCGGSWRLSYMLMWMCVKCVQPLAVPALSLPHNVRVWTAHQPSVSPCCFCHH